MGQIWMSVCSQQRAEEPLTWRKSGLGAPPRGSSPTCSFYKWGTQSSEKGMIFFKIKWCISQDQAKRSLRRELKEGESTKGSQTAFSRIPVSSNTVSAGAINDITSCSAEDVSQHLIRRLKAKTPELLSDQVFFPPDLAMLKRRDYLQLETGVMPLK